MVINFFYNNDLYIGLVLVIIQKNLEDTNNQKYLACYELLFQMIKSKGKFEFEFFFDYIYGDFIS